MDGKRDSYNLLFTQLMNCFSLALSISPGSS